MEARAALRRHRVPLPHRVRERYGGGDVRLFQRRRRPRLVGQAALPPQGAREGRQDRRRGCLLGTRAAGHLQPRLRLHQAHVEGRRHVLGPQQRVPALADAGVAQPEAGGPLLFVVAHARGARAGWTADQRGVHPEPLRGAAREPGRGAVRGQVRHVGRGQEHGHRVQEVSEGPSRVCPRFWWRATHRPDVVGAGGRGRRDGPDGDRGKRSRRWK